MHILKLIDNFDATQWASMNHISNVGSLTSRKETWKEVVAYLPGMITHALDAVYKTIYLAIYILAGGRFDISVPFHARKNT